MEANKVLKALRVCAGGKCTENNEVNDCPWSCGDPICLKNQQKDTIACIQSLQAELERLQNCGTFKILRQTQAELERVKAERDRLLGQKEKSCRNCKHWRPKTNNPCVAPSGKSCNLKTREAWEFGGLIPNP